MRFVFTRLERGAALGAGLERGSFNVTARDPKGSGNLGLRLARSSVASL